MDILLWGVRGSVPYSNPDRVKIGCNTPCVSIRVSQDELVVFDAGTGICGLGHSLDPKIKKIYIVFSHFHWDHLQGLPFFAPLYQNGIEVFLLSQFGTQLKKVLGELMDGTRFPIAFENLAIQPTVVVSNACTFLKKRGIQISSIALNHPGGCFGYKLEVNSKKMVYFTDNELPEHPYMELRYSKWVDFCKHADILIHDGQYLDSERPKHLGWGHSFIGDVVRFCKQAEVKKVVLFHHDPSRTDVQLKAVLQEARSLAKLERCQTKIELAKELGKFVV